MALAARCPQCGTSFRVVSDQLKLKGGLVRCGECRQVFDALAHLNALEEAAVWPPPPGAAPPAPATAPAEAAPPSAPNRVRASRHARSEAAAGSVPVRSSKASGAGAGSERAADSPPSSEAPPAEGLPRASAPSELERTEIEPAFLRPRKSRPLAVAGWAVVSLLLAALLVVQSALLLRAELVGRWPALRPALEELCRYAHCTVQWPRRPELLTLLGSDLEALPGTDAFEFSGTLRNRAESTVAAPAIELTLAAADGRVVARKVWLPQELYGDAGRGIEAGGELEFRIGFAAAEVKPASFVAYPLYVD
ncbi:MAG: zinc-ribbon and DUF3426 domain-containing protein [Betaproteobacteria bacterium]